MKHLLLGLVPGGYRVTSTDSLGHDTVVFAGSADAAGVVTFTTDSFPASIWAVTAVPAEVPLPPAPAPSSGGRCGGIGVEVGLVVVGLVWGRSVWGIAKRRRRR